MSTKDIQPTEADPRFPSGPWTGFFTDRRLPGKNTMELRLTFQEGKMFGEGRDLVGSFVVSGIYHTDDGRCIFDKTYLKAHTVEYSGYNEGKGIWGRWDLHDAGHHFTGGFHIWPEGMPDPTLQRLSEEAPIPDEIELIIEQEKGQPIPVGVQGKPLN